MMAGSIRELSLLIGAEAVWTVHGLSVPVVIVDAREVFGRVDVLIRPVGGTGEKWTDKGNVMVTTGKDGNS